MKKASPIILPALLFFFGLLISYWFSHLQFERQKDRRREQISAKLDSIRGNLSRELYSAIHLTAGISGLVSAEGSIDPQRFQAIAGELIRHNEFIRNIALAPSNVIRFVYPLKGNEKVLGMDYMKVPEQRDTVLRSMREKRMVVAGPVELIQGGIGIIGRMPIFLSAKGNKSQDIQTYWGISATVIDFRKLIRAAELDARAAQIQIALRGKDGLGPEGSIFWGEAKVFSSHPVVMEVPLPSGKWQIAAIPASGWPPFKPLSSTPFLINNVIVLILTLLSSRVLWVSQERKIEVQKRKKTEAELRQTNRALRLLSLCNTIVVQALDEESLLKDLCRIAVESAGYRMAWVGRAENDEARTVTPITFAGPGEGVLDQVHVSWGDNPHGQGTAGHAIRTRRPAIARDLRNNPSFAIWREALQRRDFSSAIALPLIVEGSAFGVLVIYAAEPDAFDTTEVGLLEELGENIAHGIAARRAQKERAEAIAGLERTRNELEQEIFTRKAIEENLAESEEKHRRLFETLPYGIVYQDPGGKIIYANPAAEKILGVSFTQMKDRTSGDSLWSALHENGAPFPGESHPSMIALRTGQSVNDSVMGIYNPTRNARRWVKVSAIPLFKSGENVPYQVYAVFDDITEHKELQAQFLQSQKMEAIGELAGGVAHDFNNLLTVIKGYSEILIDSLPQNTSLREDAMEILNAGKQAASLTAQLLAFSRKQILQPKILQLNDIVSEVGKMLNRLLGENIRLEFKCQPNLGLIHADPGKIQQILLNLAINGRDAMPAGGKLEIKTADAILDNTHVCKYPFLKPGAYVLLAMSDTGIGMDAATQARIFEPFFTTKTQGSGTGLGLSTVYGIVKQSNGFIWVDSELGKGASFKIYFPRAEGEAELIAREDTFNSRVRNNETILLAEDESSVRALVARILRGRGYTVLESFNGKEALEVARAYKGTIHLVLTDSVMPEMSGKELVSQLENQRPGIKVLYVSGYTNSGIVHEDILDPGVSFLQKPFTGEQLIRKIQSVLYS